MSEYSESSAILLAVLFGILYFMSWLFVRHNHIVLPAQRRLVAMIESIKERIVTEQDKPEEETGREKNLKNP